MKREPSANPAPGMRPETLPQPDRTAAGRPEHGTAHVREWTLEECPVGQDMRVTGVRMDERHMLRMLELGIRAGGLVRVTQRSNFGGRVIAIGTGRIAIDASTAQSITVRAAEPNTHGEQS
ncbi:FeoA family protein [Bifidobacterium thermacidophilum]|uniref:FeoA family protein n=1 Tax=Bifidobacterium thermacidophilum TaxID=246618 RepID=UPI001EE6688F|nr:ferrous iron transport protein A [Bifidobacterium thermacidophilum]